MTFPIPFASLAGSRVRALLGHSRIIERRISLDGRDDHFSRRANSKQGVQYLGLDHAACDASAILTVSKPDLLYSQEMTERIQTLTMRASLKVERALRYSTDVLAEAMLLDLPTVDVRMVNISKSGCLFLSPFDLPIGTSVLLTISGIGMHGAIVRRADGASHGASFRTPLSERDLDTVRRLETAFKGVKEDVVPAPITGARKLLASLQARLRL